MDASLLERRDQCQWVLPPGNGRRVPVVIFATEELLREMDQKVLEQASNVATLPGIQKASYVMPDAHWGYGFPIGGVAAFDPEQDGVVSAGGVGFDISCGVRTLLTELTKKDLLPKAEKLADKLFQVIPAGVGSRGKIRLSGKEMDQMLSGGARWALERGYGLPEDLERIEEKGCMPGADPSAVSPEAKKRQEAEMGTLGSGNHYLEVQEVAEIYDPKIAEKMGLTLGQIVVSIHCGSRGLGHQIGTDYLKKMVSAAASYGIRLPERELACAPLNSPLGKEYLGAMRAGINCALANRQILTHLAREAFAEVFPGVRLSLLYDVSHNTCKEEVHEVDGHRKRLFVHRKGATRALGPGHPELPEHLRALGQPVLIGGSMGTHSYVLVGTEKSEELAFSSAIHGAGRAMSRHQATKLWKGKEIIEELARRGILIRSVSERGVAEEAPKAYKDVSLVVEAADQAGLARKVARLDPVICIKG
jgi:tRNA-splicing ligase RtcB